MKVTLEKEKENVVSLDITIPAKDATEAYNNAVRRIAQYVNIDVKTMNFLYRKIKCYSFQKWLGSNMLYVLLMRCFIRFFLNKVPAKFKRIPFLEN